MLSGIYDMLAIGVNSILTGYYWIVGGWYCTHPETNFVLGAIGLGWFRLSDPPQTQNFRTLVRCLYELFRPGTEPTD